MEESRLIRRNFMTEMEETSTPVAETIVCPKCQSEEPEGQSFCSKCGTPLTEEAASQKEKKTTTTVDGIMKEVDQEEHKKHVKQAGIAIIVVAVLTILYAGFLWFQLSSEISKVEANPMMVVNQEVVSQARFQIGLVFGLGVVFIGLFFWSKVNPFAASLTALVIYITDIIVSIGIEPSAIYKGIIIKIIIILALANGVKAGLAYNQERKRKRMDK